MEFGLDRSTPGYITMAETDLDKIRIETGKRAMEYELKIRGGKTDNVILKECVRVLDMRRKEEEQVDK